MKIKNRKSFVQIGTHVYKDNHWHKKEQKKNTSIYNVQDMHIKKKGEEPKIQKENSILFESQLRRPIDLIKNWYNDFFFNEHRSKKGKGCFLKLIYTVYSCLHMTLSYCNNVYDFFILQITCSWRFNLFS